MPFQFTPYQPDTRSILALMQAGPAAQAAALRASGDARARAMEIGGQARAQAAQGIGQAISGSIGELMKQREEAPYRAAQIENMRAQAEDRKLAGQQRADAARTNQTIDALMKDSLTTDPTTGATTYDRGKLQQGFTQAGIGHEWPKYSELVDKSDASVKTLKEAHHNAIKDVAALVDAAGNDATVFTNELMRGVKNGLFTEAEAAPLFEAAQRDPTHVAKITAMVLGKKPELKEVTAGASLVDPNNPQAGAVFTAPTKAAPPPNPTEASLAMAAQSPDPNISGPARAALATMRAQHPPAAQTGTGSGDIQGNFDTTGDEFLKSIPVQWRSTVKKIGSYDEDAMKVAAARGGERSMIMRWVNQYNPGYDASMFANRAPTRKAYTTGTQGKQITNINTALGHIDQLDAVASQLQTGGFVPGNKAFNAVRTAFGSDKVTNFDTLKDALAGEVAGVLSQSGATVSGIADAQAKIHASSSPTQLAGYVKTLIPIMGSKLAGLDYSYHQAMGADDSFSALSPESKRILTKHGFDPAHPTLSPGASAPTTATAGTIRAKDQQGNIHEAPAGTPLPKDWVLQ